VFYFYPKQLNISGNLMHFLKLCCPLGNKLIIIKKKNFPFFFEKKGKKNDGSIEI
jgi:hypothetical protein